MKHQKDIFEASEGDSWLERITTTVLKKNTAYAYLNEPYKAP